jgi:hypothetical protein
MSVYTSATSKVYVSGVATGSENQAAFEAKSWIEIGEISNIGVFGDAASEINFTAVSDRRVRKFKGSFNAGNLVLEFGLDMDDAGQDVLRAAQASDSDYCFRVDANDNNAASPTDVTKWYFSGKVMDAPVTIGTAENITMSAASIGINTAIITVARA